MLDAAGRPGAQDPAAEDRGLELQPGIVPINTPSGSPSTPAMCPRRSSRTKSASQRAVVNSRCIPSGAVSPACSASDQLVLRSRPDSIPPRHARARTRTSRRKRWPATTANASSSLACSGDPSTPSALASAAALGISVPTS
jgi:hypothetical protein